MEIKYIALGILLGYFGCYALSFASSKLTNQETDQEETK